MQRTLAPRILSVISFLAPGLYAGRLLSEWLNPGPILALALTLLAAATTYTLLRRRFAARVLWSALPLLIYVFYPFYQPPLAFGVGALALVATFFASAPHLPRLFWRPSTRTWAVLVFLGSLALYVATVAPGLLPADSGELQVVAAQLGVAHPPGFALYTLLAHLATRIPLGATAAYRVNALSALIAAGTLSLVFLSAVRLARSHSAAFVAVMALASATTFWSQATTANVRIFTAFFATLAIYQLLRIRDGRATHGEQADNPRGVLLFLFTLTLSLGVTHHASLIFMGLIFGLTLLWLDPYLVRQPSRWPAPLAGLLLGLLPLLYFPLRATAPVRGASPALATVRGFIEHVLAFGFRGDLFAFSEPLDLWARLQVMGNVMTFQFHWLLLAGMLVGAIRLLRAQPKMALALGGAFVLHALVTASYRAPQTVEYMLPAYVPAALLLAVAAGIPRHWEPRSQENPAGFMRIAPALLTSLVLVVVVAQGLQRFSSFNRLGSDRAARSYAETIMEQAPEDSIVLADWHWATPLWYMQEVEEQRSDLAIRYVFPTAEPYGETWARRIAENLAQERDVVTTHFDASTYGALPAPEPLGEALLFRRDPRRHLPDGYSVLDATLGGMINLLGYQLRGTPLIPGEEAVVTVAWRPVPDTTPPDVTFFAHLVNRSDGEIYAQQDVPLRPAAEGITLTQLRFTPRLAAQPGDYFLYVGAYESSHGRPLADADGATRIRLRSPALQAMRQRPFTAHPQYGRPVSGEQYLVGYDWDHTLGPGTRLYLHWRSTEGYITEVIDDPTRATELPPAYGPWGIVVQRQVGIARDRQFYVPLGGGVLWTGAPQLNRLRPSPGEEVALTQHFVAARPLHQDIVVSVRLIGYEADGVHWDWWDLQDNVPALGAIPTLKWIEGSRVRDPHFLTVSPDAATGQTLGGLVTLYDAFTQRPLPILDERITEQHLGIPLGVGQVR